MEEWKPIPGYEGLYEASNFGNIRTAEGKTTSNARYEKRVWKQRIMKQKFRKRKERTDAIVTLWKNGKEKTHAVSRLIAMTWCEGYKEGLTVNHIDGNPTNNSATNLEWLTIKDNIRHGFETGLYHSQKPCSLKDDKGNLIHFRSMSEASRFLGRSNSYVYERMKKNGPLYSANGGTYGFA